MPIKTFPIGPLSTNCYVLHNATQAVIIDAGGDMQSGLDQVVDFLANEPLTLLAVICTHLHCDHLYGVATLQRDFKVPVYASKADASLLESDLGGGGKWGFPKVESFAFEPLEPGPHTFGDMELTVLVTPGHTPGGLCLYVPAEKAVLAGDTLFYRSVGRSDFAGGSQETLRASIRKELFTLPPETVVYPGHGMTTIIGDEVEQNPYA